MGRNRWCRCYRNTHWKRSGCDRNTNCYSGLNIEEQPDLQSRCNLTNGLARTQQRRSGVVGTNHRCIIAGSLRIATSYRYKCIDRNSFHSLGSKGRLTDIAIGMGNKDCRPRKSKDSLTLKCRHLDSSKFDPKRG